MPEIINGIELSIVIVNYNTKDLILQLLQSIAGNNRKNNLEIIVVDNNSSDGSVLAIQEKFPWVKLVVNKENIGFSRANNIGAAQARGNYILLLNSDTILINNAPGIMIDYIKQHPEVGILGCKLVNGDGSLQFSAGTFPTLWTEFVNRCFLSRIFQKTKLFGSYKLSYWHYNSDRDVDWVTGACLLIRTEIVKKVGLFDENIFMFYEDVDLCWRVLRAGWKIRFMPDAQVIHLWGGSWKKARADTIFNNYKSACYFFNKHYNRQRLVFFKIIYLVESLARSAVALLTMILDKNSSSAKFKGYSRIIKDIVFTKF